MKFPRFEVEVVGLDALVQNPLPDVVERLHGIGLMVGQHMQQVWTAVAQEKGAHGIGDYVRGISAADSLQVEVSAGAYGVVTLDVTVTNRDPKAYLVEEGHPAFHLPERVDWTQTGGSIKQGKNGPYLHIPFRHAAYADANTRESKGYLTSTLRSMMPADVSAEAAGLRRRLANRAGPQRDAKGFLVRADTYRWEAKNKGAPTRLFRNMKGPAFVFGAPGGEAGVEEWRSARLIGHDKAGNAQVNPAWKSSKFEGLMKTGPKGHTAYLTIRTMTPNSPGWWIPAKQGKWIVPMVLALLRSSGTVERFFAAGLNIGLDGTEEPS